VSIMEIAKIIEENPYNPLLGLVVGVEKCAECGRHYILKEKCHHQLVEDKRIIDRLAQTEKLLDMIEKTELSITEMRGIIKFLKA